MNTLNTIQLLLEGRRDKMGSTSSKNDNKSEVIFERHIDIPAFYQHMNKLIEANHKRCRPEDYEEEEFEGENDEAEIEGEEEGAKENPDLPVEQVQPEYPAHLNPFSPLYRNSQSA